MKIWKITYEHRTYFLDDETEVYRLQSKDIREQHVITSDDVSMKKAVTMFDEWWRSVPSNEQDEMHIVSMTSVGYCISLEKSKE